MDFSRYDRVRPLLWNGDSLRVIDQRVLPVFNLEVANAQLVRFCFSLRHRSNCLSPF